MQRATTCTVPLVNIAIAAANLLSFALILLSVAAGGRHDCSDAPLYMTRVSWHPCGAADAPPADAPGNGSCLCVSAGRRYVTTSIVAETVADRADARDLVALLLALAYAASFAVGISSHRGARLPSVDRDPNPPQWPLLVEHSLTQPLVVAAMCVACGVRDLAVVLTTAALALAAGAIHATVDAMRYSCCDTSKPSWSNWSGSIVFAQFALVAVATVAWGVLYAAVFGGDGRQSAAAHVGLAGARVLFWGTLALHGAYIATQFAQMYIYYDHDVLKGQACARTPDPAPTAPRRAAFPAPSRSTTLVRVAYPAIITANRSLVAAVALWNPRREHGIL